MDHYFKDEYLLNFLGLSSEYDENDLRKSLVEHIREFLRELGHGFMFGGEEYKIRVGNEEFRIDMLFYHRQLRCIVTVELKIGKFRPEYLGQLEFYLAALDEQEKLKHESPSVGLLLCKDKDHEVVRLALSHSLSPIKVASYKTELPDERLLAQKLHSLSIPQQLLPNNKKITLRKLLEDTDSLSPSQVQSKLKLSKEELRREVRRGQRQGWLLVSGTGRSVRYQLIKS